MANPDHRPYWQRAHHDWKFWGAMFLMFSSLAYTAHAASTQQKAVLRVVGNLAAFNGIVVSLLITYACILKMPGGAIVSLALTGVLASIPVALPATFNLAAALGARALAKRNILPTRLSAWTMLLPST